MSVDYEQPMSVGVEEIDARHRQIARRVRVLARAVAEGGVEPIRAALRSLQVVLADHHAREEAWMAELGYPGAREHVRSHGSIAVRISLARAEEGEGAEARLAEAAASIAQVIEDHMRSDDLRLGRFWVARENLRRLAEHGPGVGMSLTPMPGAYSAVTPVPDASARATPAPRAAAATREDGGRDQPAAPPSPRTRK